MKELYCFKIDPNFEMEQAWQELENSGVELAYGTEEEEGSMVFGYLLDSDRHRSWPCVQAVTLTTLPSIDWDSQWKEHGLDFYDGVVHVDLQKFSSHSRVLKLKPGPGFGDLSHPTTRLVLRLMATYISPASHIIDIGCGSGVLALAAIAMGAAKAYGIDVDEKALIHTAENAQANEMEKNVFLSLPDAFTLSTESNSIIVMNMIYSEQIDAWNSLPVLHAGNRICLVSGIRLEEKEIYLKQIAKWKWTILQELAEDGWLGFACIQNNL